MSNAPTVPAPQSTDAQLPASDTVRIAYEGTAYVEAVRKATIEKSERETRRDIPAARVGRYCIVPPRAA